MELLKKEENDQQIPAIGCWVEDKGIYQGTWEPTDEKGKSLGSVFNLYAAPEDLKNIHGKNLLLTFNKAIRHIAKLKNWHGHSGSNLKSVEDIRRAVQSNPEKLSSWFIPNKEILHGYDSSNKKLQINNLYNNKEEMPKNSEFVTIEKINHAHLYWSCTKHEKHFLDMYAINFTDGSPVWGQRHISKFSTRPVRAELRP